MKCDWAACNRQRAAFMDGYWHCNSHYRDHLEEFHPDKPRTTVSSVRDTCGTRSAYEWHKRHGEPACEPCRAAKKLHTAQTRRRVSLSA